MESLYPINNISYHFMRVQSGITTEMVVYRNKTFNNSDELKRDIDDCKGIINFSEYSDMFITCCTLNSDYQQTTYLWGTDHANRNIYKFTLYGIKMCSEKKIPITTTEESKHDVTSDIKINPKSKSSSTEEKKLDIEQNSQSSESTDKQKPIPIYYNDTIIQYHIPGEPKIDDITPVFDEFNNITKYIYHPKYDYNKPVPIYYYNTIVGYNLCGYMDTKIANGYYENNKLVKYVLYSGHWQKNPKSVFDNFNNRKYYKMPKTNCRPIPIIYKGDIVRYLINNNITYGFNVKPVFDKFNNIVQFIIIDCSIKDTSKTK